MSTPTDRIPHELAALGLLVGAVARYSEHQGHEAGCALCGALQAVEGALQDTMRTLVDQVRGEHLLERGQLYPAHGCAVCEGLVHAERVLLETTL